ncbi:protein FAM50 homolog [Plodia interpunctella]|uniref:protein FAM50 homolog n=1 Tax=Plodia interpunctella TaxID=58824 RepID=UPI0023680E95|nr:protein FAM50 homolog [Plodia interpunctella]
MAHYKGAASEAGRAMHLMKKREKAQQEIELRKKKIEEDLKIDNIENKFATHYDAVEQQLKSSTIGLVTLDEMKAKQEHIVREREKKLAQKKAEKEKERQKEIEAKQAQKNKQKRQIQALSFDFDGAEEEDEDSENEKEKPEAKAWRDKEEPTLKKVRKNPDVDTSFLPDREREEADLKLREQLRLEWVMTQATLKDEPITVTFSYWDGSGHRRNVTLKKGNSIYQFLQRCLDTLRPEFSELKTVSADQLMYVKEDLILPHHYTFYDFIVTKARGKSGPLFQFDAADDVRLVNDATQEKQDSHAGKVLLRSWYERNKHIFPASRWEPYDPTKTYSKYTIKGK